MPKYIDGSNNFIPPYAMPIGKDTASLANAEYLRAVVEGDIVPTIKPVPTTADPKSLTSVGYINNVTPETSIYVAPDIDDVGLQSLVNIGTANMELEGAIVPVTGVTLNKSTTSLDVGATETLIATVTPADATNKTVIWDSSSTAAATVDSEGLVTAVAEGATVITATTQDGGKTATCTVSVTAA